MFVFKRDYSQKVRPRREDTGTGSLARLFVMLQMLMGVLSFIRF
jgi:hypothetical protein